jgi:heme-degrading monooxygenase HmoA
MSGHQPRFATTPDPPYIAVIFSSQRAGDHEGYEAMSALMVKLSMAHDGCLGAESTRDSEGFGITVSYWTTEQAVADWKADSQHQIAQRLGRERWYEDYQIRIATVTRAYASF